jgi:hypothetical protein
MMLTALDFSQKQKQRMTINSIRQLIRPPVRNEDDESDHTKQRDTIRIAIMHKQGSILTTIGRRLLFSFDSLVNCKYSEIGG